MEGLRSSGMVGRDRRGLFELPISLSISLSVGGRLSGLICGWSRLFHGRFGGRCWDAGSSSTSVDSASPQGWPITSKENPIRQFRALNNKEHPKLEDVGHKSNLVSYSNAQPYDIADSVVVLHH